MSDYTIKVEWDAMRLILKGILDEDIEFIEADIERDKKKCILTADERKYNKKMLKHFKKVREYYTGFADS